MRVQLRNEPNNPFVFSPGAQKRGSYDYKMVDLEQ
jgi:hypothetical protein